MVKSGEFWSDISRCFLLVVFLGRLNLTKSSPTPGNSAVFLPKAPNVWACSHYSLSAANIISLIFTSSANVHDKVPCKSFLVFMNRSPTKLYRTSESFGRTCPRLNLSVSSRHKCDLSQHLELKVLLLKRLGARVKSKFSTACKAWVQNFEDPVTVRPGKPTEIRLEQQPQWQTTVLHSL